MKKTLLATSIAIALGFSAQTFAQPTLQDINFADDSGTAMDDGNLVGNTATITNTADIDAASNSSTNDSNNTSTKTDVAVDADLNASTNDSNNTTTTTDLALDADVDIDSSTNTLTKTVSEANTSTKTHSEANTETNIGVGVDASASADNGSLAMRDGNTLTNTELTIGDVTVDAAVNVATLSSSVTGGGVTVSAGTTDTAGGTINAYNNLSGGSMNFTGVGISNQNTGAQASTQANINVQANLGSGL